LATRPGKPACHDRGAAGFVLAGGKSSRMGRDKARLELGGETLLVRSLRILRDARLTTAIIGFCGPPIANAPNVADVEPNLGPLSGICGALASTPARHSVFISVDMPFLPPSLIVYLLRRAQITLKAVTVVSVNGLNQTFPAVIDRVALSTFQAEIAAGRNGCFSAFQAAATGLGQTVDVIAAELLAQSGQAADPDGLPPIQWFLNLNTQADLERAEALLARRIA
jgi:molybdenum cofactor guanylyltransferase